MMKNKRKSAHGEEAPTGTHKNNHLNNNTTVTHCQAKLINIENAVCSLLHTMPAARGDDNLLYYHICVKCAEAIGEPLYSFTASDFLLNKHSYGFPCFESVRRARQKAQAKYPALCPPEGVMNGRRIKKAEIEGWVKDAI